MNGKPLAIIPDHFIFMATFRVEMNVDIPYAKDCGLPGG